jgi:hypothetical protein
MKLNQFGKLYIYIESLKKKKKRSFKNVISDAGEDITHQLGALVLHERGEALVQPQVRPPLERDKVPEPLVSHLVGDGGGHLKLGLGRVELSVEQQVLLPIYGKG